MTSEPIPSHHANISNQHHHELSPLLVSSESSSIDDHHHHHHHDHRKRREASRTEMDQWLVSSSGSASVLQTMINLAKTCMGTGCLALPFAAQQGGLLLYTVGTIAIAVWNVFSSKRLVDCLELLSTISTKDVDDNGDDHHHDGYDPTNQLQPDQHRELDAAPEEHPNCCCPKTAIPSLTLRSQNHHHHPPPGTATLGILAWYGMGPWGLTALDIMTVILLLGIITAYQDAMQSFLKDTPLTTRSDLLDAAFIALMMAPLSIVPNMGYLSKISAAGLTVLATAFCVIAGYGMVEYDARRHSDHANDPANDRITLYWLPQNGLTGISHWFGCTVFGFGVVPLTFNFRESMAEPNKLVGATTMALIGVAVCYIIVGIGLWILYPNIEGDVLHELPSRGILPMVTRLAMVLVVLVTAPLLIVPCGELIEGKFLTTTDSTPSSYKLKIMTRFGICFITVGISVGVPGFVYVLSFVGCFCVALVSFCIPPLLHLLLLTGGNGRQRRPRRYRLIPWTVYAMDSVMFLWGITATAISTMYTFHNVLPKTS